MSSGCFRSRQPGRPSAAADKYWTSRRLPSSDAKPLMPDVCEQVRLQEPVRARANEMFPFRPNPFCAATALAPVHRL